MHSSRRTNSTNWANNVEYNSSELVSPSSIEQIQGVVRSSQVLKGLGSRHSFNTIADTTGVHVDGCNLVRDLELDTAARTVTIRGAVSYGELAPFLWDRGWAVPNMASLPHISVIGACATATHGSGNSLGNLATSVRAFEIVTGSGDLRVCSREQDGAAFDGMVVHLGALGVVTSITLEVVPRFFIAQNVYRELPREQLMNHFDKITGGGYSVSLFTDWNETSIRQVWLKQKVDTLDVIEPQESFFGAYPASVTLHPVETLSAECCTAQLGEAGPAHERLPHFKLSHTPSVGDELQSEYFVRRQDAVEAIQRLMSLRDEIRPLLLISEIRTIAADNLWLSPCHRGDSVGIHFTWRALPEAVMRLLPRLEECLGDLEPIPHWGKITTMPAPEIARRYPRMNDFAKLVKEFDPTGRCANDFLRSILL